MSNQSQLFNLRYWNYRFNNYYYYAVSFYYNKCHHIINYYYNNYYYAIIHYYNDYYYYEILRMLLELLVRIFTSILKSRWNSIALVEPEYKRDIASCLIVATLSPCSPHHPHMSCIATSAHAIDSWKQENE